MTGDILTMIWKEARCLLRQSGSRSRAALGLAMVVVMVGILMPVQLSDEWLNSAWSLLVAYVMPLLLVGVTIPESFAGERERHTLPTLLASRLPDRAILFGKLITAIVYGWTVTLAILLVSLLVANVVQRQNPFAFYHPVVFFADALISLLISGLVAALGVLISLHSATAQGAQQALVFALLVPFLVVQIAPLLLMTAVPDGRAILSQLLAVDFGQVVLTMAALLVVTDAALLLAGMAQFKRAKLSLM